MFGEASVPTWTAIAAISACATIVVTGVFSYLTVKLMRQQSEPKVIVFLRHNPERQSIIYIVIRNVGQDLAERVSFTASRPIPAKAFGIEKPNSPSDFMKAGPLIRGIPSLGPNEERVLIWGQFGGLKDALEKGGPMKLEYSYFQGKRRFKRRR